MNDVVLTCKQCGAELELTDSLAAPLIEEARLDFERKLLQKTDEINRQKKEVESRRLALEGEQEAFDSTVAERVAAQILQVSAAEARKAREAVQNQIAAQEEELQELKRTLADTVDSEARKAKAAAKLELEQQKRVLEETTLQLQAADNTIQQSKLAEADFLKKTRELDTAKRVLEVTVQKKVNEELETMQRNLRVEFDTSNRIKLRDKDIQLQSMKVEIENLKRKSDQGSQQIQGEAQEQEIAETLTAKFPNDVITRVGRGTFGGDCIQQVHNGQGKHCGTILWESKRTRSWSSEWLTKLKSDQHAAQADVAIIVSQVLPKGVEVFEQVGEVWVAGLNCIIPVAGSLRHLLIEMAAAKRQTEGHRDKAALIYQYVTSVGFRQSVKEMTEAYTIMQSDLRAEQKAIKRQWAKRETQLSRMIDATTGMYGDLQGIAGKSVPEIDGIGFDLLGS